MSFDHNADLIDALNAVLRACDDAEAAIDEDGSSIECSFDTLGVIRATARSALAELAAQND